MSNKVSNKYVKTAAMVFVLPLFGIALSSCGDDDDDSDGGSTVSCPPLALLLVILL